MCCFSFHDWAYLILIDIFCQPCQAWCQNSFSGSWSCPWGQDLPDYRELICLVLDNVTIMKSSVIGILDRINGLVSCSQRNVGTIWKKCGQLLPFIYQLGHIYPMFWEERRESHKGEETREERKGEERRAWRRGDKGGEERWPWRRGEQRRSEAD